MGTNTEWSPGWAKVAQATPLKATTDPRERSTPAVSRTNVTPTARMPLIEIWRATLVKFATLRKVSVSNDKARPTNKMTSRRPKR